MSKIITNSQDLQKIIEDLKNIKESDKLTDETKRDIIALKNALLKSMLEKDYEYVNNSFFDLIEKIIENIEQTDNGAIFISSGHVLKRFFETNYPKDFIRILTYFFNIKNLESNKIQKIKEEQYCNGLKYINEWCNSYQDVELSLLNYKIKIIKLINKNPKIDIMKFTKKQKCNIIKLKKFLLNVIKDSSDKMSKRQAQIFFGGFVQDFIFTYPHGISSFIFEKDEEEYFEIKKFFEIQ